MLPKIKKDEFDILVLNCVWFSRMVLQVNRKLTENGFFGQVLIQERLILYILT